VGLLLSAVRAGDISVKGGGRRAPSSNGAAARGRSTALSSKCRQCHVAGQVTRLQNTDKVADDLKFYTWYKVDAIPVH